MRKGGYIGTGIGLALMIGAFLTEDPMWICASPMCLVIVGSSLNYFSEEFPRGSMGIRISSASIRRCSPRVGVSGHTRWSRSGRATYVGFHLRNHPSPRGFRRPRPTSSRPYRVRRK
jgi:hypothetical protein